MSNKLRSHVVSDKIKWIIAFVLIALLCIGTSLTVVKLWIKPDLFEEKTDETETVAVMRYTFASLGEGVPSSSIALMSEVSTYANSEYFTFDGSVVKFAYDMSNVKEIVEGSISITDTNLTYSIDQWGEASFNAADLAQQDKLEYNREYVVTYSISYFAVGDYGLPSGFDFGEAGRFTLQTVSELPPAPTKTGYTFTGWYTDAACTKPYTDDKVIGDITLYAGFRANTYSVKFNANGGTGSMSNQSMTYDQSKALTANAFSKTGYTFKGWASSASGSVAYSNSQSVKNLSATQGATVNLYAVWGANTYTITFNANGGSGSMSKQTLTYDKAANLTSNAFTRKNHEFKGWATSAGGEVVYTNGQSVNNLTATSGGNVNLYAVWELVTYNVSFSVDGQVTSTIEVEKETAATLPEEPSKEGYNFVGWTLPSGEIYTNQAITADTVLTAKFEIIKCVVTFIVDGQVYAYYECDWGTQLKDLLEQTDINTLLYAPEGEQSQNF